MASIRPSSNAISTITRCVLVVEDDPLMQQHLETMIEAAGYSVTSVSTLQQAREATSAVFFPIVLIDRKLADGDGIDLCNDLRSRAGQNRSFLLVLSALDSPRQIAEGINAGADAYLSKYSSDVEILAYLDIATRTNRVSRN